MPCTTGPSQCEGHSFMHERQWNWILELTLKYARFSLDMVEMRLRWLFRNNIQLLVAQKNIKSVNNKICYVTKSFTVICKNPGTLNCPQIIISWSFLSAFECNSGLCPSELQKVIIKVSWSIEKKKKKTPSFFSLCLWFGQAPESR